MQNSVQNIFCKKSCFWCLLHTWTQNEQKFSVWKAQKYSISPVWEQTQTYQLGILVSRWELNWPKSRKSLEPNYYNKCFDNCFKTKLMCLISVTQYENNHYKKWKVKVWLKLKIQTRKNKLIKYLHLHLPNLDLHHLLGLPLQQVQLSSFLPDRQYIKYFDRYSYGISPYTGNIDTFHIKKVLRRKKHVNKGILFEITPKYLELNII